MSNRCSHFTCCPGSDSSFRSTSGSACTSKSPIKPGSDQFLHLILHLLVLQCLQDILPIPGRNLRGSKHDHCHSHSLNTILNEGECGKLYHSRMMLNDVNDYAFITSILYVYKTLQLSLFFHVFLHFIRRQYLSSCNEKFCKLL